MTAGLLTPVALFLALVLAMSSAQKLAARQRAGVATANLLGIPIAQAQILALAAVLIEALAALALLFMETRPLGAAIAAGLWTVYALALVAAKRRGIAFDCACSFGARAKPVDAFALGRAFGLLAAAVAVMLAPTGGFDAGALFAALGIVALYLAAGELAALPNPHWKVAR
jgi:hypothetical protein